jgi:hypothetical protein
MLYVGQIWDQYGSSYAIDLRCVVLRGLYRNCLPVTYADRMPVVALSRNHGGDHNLGEVG